MGTDQTFSLDHVRLLGTRPPVRALGQDLRTDALGPVRLRLSDAVLDRLVQVQAVGDDLSGPRADTRTGSLMLDGADPARRWYVPRLALAEPDPSFAFAAVRQGADTEGHPFNVVHLTLALALSDPPDVVALRAAAADVEVLPVPLVDRTARLVLEARAPDGTPVVRRLAGTLGDAEGALVLTADVLGPDALLLHAALTAAGGAHVEVDLAFDLVTLVPLDPPPRRPRPGRPWRPRPLPSAPVVLPPRRPLEIQPQVLETLTLPRLQTRVLPAFAARRILQTQLAFEGDDATVVDLPEPAPVVDPVPDEPVVEPVLDPVLVPETIDPVVVVPEVVVPTPFRALHQVGRETAVVDLGLAYAATPYRPRYTLDPGDGSTRVVVDRDDLAEFSDGQSEFVELTTLGPVRDRYPSLQSLFLGRVTGTVVAVPAAYGLQRTVLGCAAACDAVVDASAASASGCRFHLTFGLLPLLDGSELLRLSSDLAAEPTLRDRVTRVVLPSELAPDPVSLAVRGAAGLTAVEGADPGSFLVTFDLPDSDVPAVVAVNLLLRQLSASPVPTLLGELRLTLDEAFAHPLVAAVRLTFRDTAGGPDLRVTSGPDGGASVEALGPVGLTVRGLVVESAGVAVARPVDLEVPAGGSVVLPVGPGDVVLGVDAELTEPAGGFDAHLHDYVATTVSSVQQVRHTVGVNGAGLLSTEIDRVQVVVVLDHDPAAALPPLVLTAGTAVQHTVWQLPVLDTLGGMPATVTVGIHRTDGSEVSRTTTHDFALEPVLTLTSELGRA